MEKTRDAEACWRIPEKWPPGLSGERHAGLLPGRRLSLPATRDAD